MQSCKEIDLEPTKYRWKHTISDSKPVTTEKEAALPALLKICCNCRSWLAIADVVSLSWSTLPLTKIELERRWTHWYRFVNLLTVELSDEEKTRQKKLKKLGTSRKLKKIETSSYQRHVTLMSISNKINRDCIKKTVYVIQTWINNYLNISFSNYFP